MTDTAVGPFRVLRKLGEGGMGEVFLAEDTTLRRRVAIKRLSSRLRDVPQAVARFRREAIALAAVSHPNIVTIYSVSEAEDVPFVVMELVEGSTLAELLPPDGFAIERVLELGLGIAAALEGAHGSGIVHRDLKPGNVMLTADGRVKVVDFGLARVLDEALQDGASAAATSQGMLVGTLAYMAPEQLVGEAADRKTDLYALGAVLFEITTGRLPFQGTTAPWLMQQILLEPAPLVGDLRPDVPERVTRLIAGLLAKEPSGRPASATLVRDELARCRRGERIAPRTSVVRQPATAPMVAAGPATMEVTRLLVRGRHLWNKRTEQSLRASIAVFQEVLDRDPMQPKAWIGIADALNLLSNYGFSPPGDSLVRVRAAVSRAVELEGDTGDALRALALAAWQFEFAWAEAEELYLRAVELDPSSALTRHWYGVLLGITRRFDESFVQLTQAEALDPLSLISLATRGWFTLFAGRPEEAHAIFRRVFSLDNAYFPVYWFDGQALTVLERHDEAIRSFNAAIDLAGRTSRLLGYLGHALGMAGRVDEARQILDELRARGREDYVPPYFPALVLAGLDERSAALELLDAALTAGDTMIRDLAIDTAWWPFADDPEYQRLLHRMGLAA